ncbi:hypothetical protein BH20ACT2_BH20ACT2_24510 [soil metagenome]
MATDRSTGPGRATVVGAEDGGDPADRLSAFRPVISAIRVGTTCVALALASPALVDLDAAVVGWCTAIVAYAVLRLLRPVRYVDDTASLLRVVAEVALHVLAVVATGYWQSPFIFSLLTAIIVAGFARGFGFAFRIGGASVLAVGLPDLARSDFGGDDLRVASQWTVELFLVALVAGYARRVSGEATRQHDVTLDRLGRLADANALLFSLHRVAQTLPASLDLDEVLDSTMGRLRDLFGGHATSVLVRDDTDDRWTVVRRDGGRVPANLAAAELPPPLRAAMLSAEVVHVADLAGEEGGGLAGDATSGLYAALPARGSLIGLVAIEHTGGQSFERRDVELLAGLVEPAALAIDNARWFARLRTVGADEERTRIARDLHDRIGQSLAYLAFELDRIVKADRRDDDVGEALEQLRDDVRGVVGEVRETLYDLRTDVSDDQDLPATLRGFLDRVRARSALEIDLQVEQTGRLALPQERELWRIAQEALANAERHADAYKVTVRWRCDGQDALLEVVDDGRGFRAGQAGRSDSYGLIGMRERAASIGAALEVVTEEAQGTVVRCRLDGRDTTAAGGRPPPPA